MGSRLEAEKKRRLAQASKILARGKSGDRLKTFADALFRDGAAEDIAGYSPEALATIARRAFAAMAKRPPKKRIVKVENIDDGNGGTVTAIDLVCGNRPFILDSVLGEIQAAGSQIRLVLHPIFEVTRDRAGRLQDFALAHRGVPSGKTRDSCIHVHIDTLADAAARKGLASRLESLIGDVHLVTDDWKAMRKQLAEAIARYTNDPPISIASETMSEAVAFLQWLEDDNFTFMGMREYSYRGLQTDSEVDSAGTNGLGILRDPDVRVLRRGNELVTMTPEVRDFLLRPEPLIVTKANVRARVHRRDYMDYIGVKLFDADEKVAGELRVVGLFTSTAFTRSVQRIPFIRKKVDGIIATAGFDPTGHSGKALLNILEGYPRTELFQADEKSLTEAALAILKLHEHPRVRAISRRDRFDRFVSVLVYVPRDRYNSDVRVRIGDMLADIYEGRISAYYPDFPEGSLARVHFIVGRNPGVGPEPTQEQVEERIHLIIRTWSDDLHDSIAAAFDGDVAAQMLDVYGDAFPSDFRASYAAADALDDVRVAETLVGGDAIAVKFLRGETMQEGRLRLRFHHLETPIPLSRRVPLLENLGFRVINERTYKIQPIDAPPLFLHDMMLEADADFEVEFDSLSVRLAETVHAVWDGRGENDRFNMLVMRAGLSWRESALLRAIGGYLRQVQVPYSPDYLADALARYADIASLLVELFQARFEPRRGKRAAEIGRLDKALLAALDDVVGLDDDTILRAFRDVVQATLRTDYFMVDADGATSPAISLKLDSAAMSFVAPPRPYREIYVHSPQVDGVHMRFGPVARGGLRWSDRPQDFRVEVLGLAKAQQVKNAVIVPVGAKGGFFPKQLPAGGDRDAIFEAGRQAYVAFVSRLLAITDDLEGDKVVPPQRVVRHDGDDPYLVVAADKGTATFSDTANAISQRRGFWLGDAFASGGSAGYDHKAMGITARGAWEAVKRHFREMDTDIQTETFTVIGVGDMSGDVFGNGMLLSKTIRLVAAFDHRDIFIDPDPDPQSSWAERKRLFELGRSSWQDYDRDLISRGGGVFSRHDKQVPLSKEMRDLLGLSKASARPTEVIRAILQMEADLLWFGGIGTYVRAPHESDLDVGDKGNDVIRITTSQLNVKVVGEGANLGMTQRARIAFGLAGGRCNSDAIDNSGGVNSSDLEVNIKIALQSAMRGDRLRMPARNTLLKKMTDEVASLVLYNNYQQTLAISLAARRRLAGMPDQLRLMQTLEGSGRLDREVEDLPSDADMEEREAAREPLTRAELGVLLAYAKIEAFDQLIASDVPDDPYLSAELMNYFPAMMRKKYSEDIEGHRLRREIIATQLANALINRCGPTILVRFASNAENPAAVLTRAFAAMRDSFGIRALNTAIDGLDNRIAGTLQLELYRIAQYVQIDRMGWALNNLDLSGSLGDIVDHYRSGLDELRPILRDLLPAFTRGRVDALELRLKEGGVPATLAGDLAFLPTFAAATDIIVVADKTQRTLTDAARAYCAITDRFRFGRIDAMMQTVETTGYYEQLAIEKARNGLALSQRQLAESLLVAGTGAPDLDAWEKARGRMTTEAAGQVETLLADGRSSIARATVAAGMMSELAARMAA